MTDFSIARRDLLLAAAVTAATPAIAQTEKPAGGAPSADQQRRMQWWHDAKFGMFIHFGLYAAHGRHEWAMEAIPVAEYQRGSKASAPDRFSTHGAQHVESAMRMRLNVDSCQAVRS